MREAITVSFEKDKAQYIPKNELTLTPAISEEMNKVPIFKRDYSPKNYFENIQYASERDRETQQEIQQIKTQEEDISNLQYKHEELEKEQLKETYAEYAAKKEQLQKEEEQKLAAKKEQLQKEEEQKLAEKKEQEKKLKMQQEKKNAYEGSTRLEDKVENIGDKIKSSQEKIDDFRLDSSRTEYFASEALSFGDEKKVEQAVDIVEDDTRDLHENVYEELDDFEPIGTGQYNRENYYFERAKLDEKTGALTKESLHDYRKQFATESGQEHRQGNFDQHVKSVRNYVALATGRDGIELEKQHSLSTNVRQYGNEGGF
jgi:chromosome segregation ATPase